MWRSDVLHIERSSNPYPFVFLSLKTRFVPLVKFMWGWVGLNLSVMSLMKSSLSAVHALKSPIKIT